MPRGGRRPGSGKKKGTQNTRTKEIAAEVLSKGVSMVEIMAGAARAAWADAIDPKSGKVIDIGKAAQAAELASKAAPYWHPKIQAMTLHGPNDDGSLTFNVNLSGADARA